MNIKEYLDKHYNELLSKVRGVTRGHQNSDDLLNDCILALLEKGHDLHHQLLRDDKIQQYLTRAAYIQYNSSTSPFHLNYRDKKYQDIDNIDVEMEEEGDVVDIDEMSKDIKLYIGKLPFYEKTLAERHFVQGISQRKMSKEYNINRIHISRDVNRIKSNIQFQFKKERYKK